MDSLKHDYLSEMPPLSFVKHLEQSVPVMQTMIKDTITVQLREWLAT